jgi:hypothetical protein
MQTTAPALELNEIEKLAEEELEEARAIESVMLRQNRCVPAR